MGGTKIIQYSQQRDISKKKILTLYTALDWSSAKKPDLLFQALMNSHTLVTAWDTDGTAADDIVDCGRAEGDERLVGLGNAISDGYLVVYFPHLIVHPEYQGRGVGRGIMEIMQEKYDGFHQQALIADGAAVEFYTKCGFERAGKTEPLWTYDGDDY